MAEQPRETRNGRFGKEEESSAARRRPPPNTSTTTPNTENEVSVGRLAWAQKRSVFSGQKARGEGGGPFPPQTYFRRLGGDGAIVTPIALCVHTYTHSSGTSNSR